MPGGVGGTIESPVWLEWVSDRVRGVQRPDHGSLRDHWKDCGGGLKKAKKERTVVAQW